jgi:hypothetical protein
MRLRQPDSHSAAAAAPPAPTQVLAVHRHPHQQQLGAARAGEAHPDGWMPPCQLDQINQESRNSLAETDLNDAPILARSRLVRGWGMGFKLCRLAGELSAFP